MQFQTMLTRLTITLSLGLCACSYEAAESAETSDPDEVIAEESQALTGGCLPGANCGLTWVKSQHTNATGQDKVSCHDYPQGPHFSCNPYVGDTDCNQKRPILCIRKDGSSSNGFVGSFYNGWAAGSIGTTHPIQGSTLTSQAAGDTACQKEFGVGWQMAEHHDGGGGWAWTAYGNLNDIYRTGDPSHTSDMRFWVAINDQAKGNCW